MLRDEWPFNEAQSLCVWSEVKWNFDWFRRCAVICPTRPGTHAWPPDWCNITKDSFPSNLSQFSAIRNNFIKVLWFPHYIRLRRFAGFNPLLIPWYQILLPTPLSPFSSHPLPLLTPAGKLDKFPLSVIISNWTARGFSPPPPPGVGTHWRFCLIKTGKDVWRGWVLALRFKALCCFNVLFTSQYRALAPM